MSEQTVIRILFSLYNYGLQSLVLHSLHCKMLTPKFGFWRTALILAAIDATAGIVVETFFPFLGGVYLVVLILMYIVPALVAFEEKKPICLLFSAIMVMFVYLGDIITALIATVIKDNTPATLQMRHGELSWSGLALAFGENFAYLTVVSVFVFLWCRRFRKWQPKKSMLFFLFPIGQLLFIASAMYRNWQENIYNPFENIFTMSALMISVMADILLFTAIRDSSKLDDLNQRIQEMENEMKLQLDYYEKLSEHITEVREYRHDINNLIAAAETLRSSDMSHEDGELLINELKEKASSLTIPVYCGNPIVNAVLWQKTRECEEKGITLSIDIKGEEDFPLDKVDICSVFSNLLDNAIRETDDGEIRISAERDLGMLMITVKNPTSKTISAEDKPKTTKKDSLRHGFGLEIVERTAEKYNGKFVLKAEDGTASAVAAFML